VDESDLERRNGTSCRAQPSISRSSNNAVATKQATGCARHDVLRNKKPSFTSPRLHLLRVRARIAA
jgi:hypothetical protein